VGGFVTPPREYFAIAVDIVRKYGGVFICDEVQTGFGRTGDKWWGIEHWGVEPEIMTMAKGIANGLPLSACVATPAIADSLKGLTISTFGGNPLSVAAANATIEFIEQQGLRENAARAGRKLREGLEELQRQHARLMGDVRGMGLMQGVEFVKDETAHDRTPNAPALACLFEETKKRGLLIGKGGLYGNVARISPPLTVSGDEVEEALRILAESLTAVEASK
jgi:4-aminobutyrate aminotransferase-like enzyme